MSVTIRKVPARFLQPGYRVGTGETVLSVESGLNTPRGKVEVLLEKNGKQRWALWGAYTNINVLEG